MIYIKNLIKNYIDRISLSDINKFGIKNNIYLNNDELTLIYNYIKNDWETLIFGNPNHILNDLKNNINKDNYIKIINLYNYYKKNYL